ncbi:PTS transporter subunit EIIC [Spiroplasma sp. Moj]|uniref:PTS transporter subunit EIIC n=1 Tax=Spiroplasma sp. Moj TaxID=1922342 RepID=UPI0039EF34ED|nr:PTS glucose transporter subunit IIABC [Spiroplasma sp. Moj]
MKIDRLYQIRKNGKGYRNNSNKIKIRNIYEYFIKIITLIIIPLLLIVLIYGIGMILQEYTSNLVALTIGDVCIKIGKAVFNNLSIIFCLVTVISITNNVKAVAIAVTGFLVFIVMQYALIQYKIIPEGKLYVTSILFFYQGKNLAMFLGSSFGLVTLNTSILGGITVGIISSYIYIKCIDLRLAKPFGLLNGFPFVTLLVVLASMFLALFFLLLWIVIAIVLNHIYQWMWQQNANHFLGAAFVYELLNTLLISFGFKDLVTNLFINPNVELLSQTEFENLFKNIAVHYGWIHNIFDDTWNNATIQKVWDFINQPTFEEHHLTILDWLNLLPIDRLPQANGYSAQTYNWFLSSNFGHLLQLKLPPNYAFVFGGSLAISTAIILTSKKENRMPTAILMTAIVVVTILTGNNVIINLFTFFVSPMLYFCVYMPLAGINGLFMSLLDVHIWVLFVNGLIDFIYRGIIPVAKGTNFFWVPVFTFIWFVIIMPIFWKAILYFDYPFIGRRETILPRITHKNYHEMWNH